MPEFRVRLRRVELAMLVRILGPLVLLVLVCYIVLAPASYAKGPSPTTQQIDTQRQGNSTMHAAAQLWRVTDAEDVKSSTGLDKLPPKAQKEMRKALEALRANKLNEARGHLDAAYRLAPTSAEVNYIFGVYSSQSNKPDQAESYWTKTLEFYPKHLNALLSLSQLLLREKKTAEALPLLKRAMEVEPSSWRSHALLCEALLLQGSRYEAIQQAERALELGHGQAAVIEPPLAMALAESGDSRRAISILQAYLKDQPADAAVKRQLETLQRSQVAVGSNPNLSGSNEIIASAFTAAVPSLPLFSTWLPPDVDERVPPVETDAACALDDVLQKAGKRIQELIINVDRFTATESLNHESINKWGLASSTETRKFDYVVSVSEHQSGRLIVDEYRHNRGSAADFPDGVATIGLPALVFIFHPNNAGAFDMNCEGLARWNGTLGWQVHFRQKSDKPNTIRAYRMGVNGPSYPVALKGRAWIAAESYQILRLETDLIAPMPQIRLATDRAVIEYGPVHFREKQVDMWLPQSAEVYYDWKGRRTHRRHIFSNYLLFSVGDSQQISAPKIED